MSLPTRLEHWRCLDWPARAFVTAGLAGIMGWVFRDLMSNCVNRWTTEPQYSHGFIIPIMAVGLGWMRRSHIPAGDALKRLMPQGFCSV